MYLHWVSTLCGWRADVLRKSTNISRTVRARDAGKTARQTNAGKRLSGCLLCRWNPSMVVGRSRAGG